MCALSKAVNSSENLGSSPSGTFAFLHIFDFVSSKDTRKGFIPKLYEIRLRAQCQEVDPSQENPVR